MASLTIRQLDESVKRRLRMQAARHGHSMEEEARVILKAGLVSNVETTPRSGKEFADAIISRFAKYDGIELDLPAREAMREPPDFSRD